MESSFPLLLAALVGFSHAFEADHLVAVTNIVTKRKNLVKALFDGVYWGLGHSLVIVILGIVMILGKQIIPEHYFDQLEGVVGIMLIGIGILRLWQYHNRKDKEHKNHHHLAFGVGLIHGLAGSGTLVLLVMSEIQSQTTSLLYLLIFGVGSIVGMLTAASLFSLPFSKKISTNEKLQQILIYISSVLCIAYGAYMVYLHF